MINLTATKSRLSAVVSQLSKMSTPIAVIAGAGPGTGAALAHKFSAEYPVVLLARNPANYEDTVKAINSASSSSSSQAPRAIGIQTDVSDRAALSKTIAQLEKTYGGPDGKGLKIAAAIFNVSGAFVRKPFLEIEEGEWEKGFEGTTKTAFTFSQLLLPYLLAPSPTKDAHPSSLIFTGATASVKGSALFSAFAAPKFALRALSQSLAREFGPKGVHVAHAVVDGVIDIPRTKGWELGEEGKIDPAAIADAYWHLHTQPRTAFTWEIDIRPAKEKW